MVNYDKVVEKFEYYLKKFDVDNEKIKIKIRHSYYVADLINKLAKYLELEEEERILAKTIGLIHDIGRFPQYQEKGLYDDYKTKINHAVLADDCLFKEGHIKDFEIEEKYHNIIRKSILNHNAFKLDTNLTEEELFFSKLIRDADKIDIFRSIVSFDLKYESSANEKLKNAFFKHELVERQYVISDSDEIISTLAFVFDINFKESFELLDETDNLELFMDSVLVSKELEEEFMEYKTEVRKYVKEKIIES